MSRDLDTNEFKPRKEPRTARAGWLREFHDRFGRAPRVLHIGNIANNAYKNAKLLNEAGIDCDVICYNYYHIMGCPEWEDAHLGEVPQDHFRPSWRGVVGGYERPAWFAQGPLEHCIAYLIARRTGRRIAASWHWRILAAHNGTGGRVLVFSLTAAAAKIRSLFVPSYAIRYLGYRIATHPQPWSALLRKLRAKISSWGRLTIWLTFVVFAPALVLSRALLRRLYGAGPQRDAHLLQLVRTFAELYPNRHDRLTSADLPPYEVYLTRWQALFEQYDVVQAYATDPIYPLLAGKRPYVGFEHGTLRDFTLADNAVSRLTALAYNQADHVFVTNGDCREYARKIGITRFSPMLHPIDERQIRATLPASHDLHTRFGVRYLFLCTLRHDWEIKGTDKYIRALPGLARTIGDSFLLLMTKWGAQLDASVALARELGVFDKIKWIDPLPKQALTRMQKSVDVLFDQIALPHFGATAPEGIAAGVPVVMSYDPSSTAWIIPEPAPVLSAWTVEEIVSQVGVALDPRWLKEYRKRATEWIDRYHSFSVVVDRHLELYATLLAPMMAESWAPGEKEVRG